jgi:hypothetical protein
MPCAAPGTTCDRALGNNPASALAIADAAGGLAPPYATSTGVVKLASWSMVNRSANVARTSTPFAAACAIKNLRAYGGPHSVLEERAQVTQTCSIVTALHGPTWRAE